MRRRYRGYDSYGGFGWKPYVPVAVRRAQAAKKLEKLKKDGLDAQPVSIAGTKIARTFWGKAWCDHLESFGDYENRLPRGRTYVRNGSVCHLEMTKGRITALVSGSELYRVEVRIKTLPAARWKEIKRRCAGQIGSLLELLQGKLSENVMAVVSDRKEGMFPQPGQINFHCSCPDWASMCKHVAAALYGVGARLDESPGLLFLLRGVSQEELISSQVEIAGASGPVSGGRKRIADDALADVFGIEMAEEEQPGTEAAASHATKPGYTTKPAKPPKPTRPKPPRQLTGRSVAKLRARLGLSRPELARLLGVSASTIGNWERTKGTLTPHGRIRERLSHAMDLTKEQARRKLDEHSE